MTLIFLSLQFEEFRVVGKEAAGSEMFHLRSLLKCDSEGSLEVSCFLMPLST